MDLGKLENAVESSADRIKEDAHKRSDSTVQRLIGDKETHHSISTSLNLSCLFLVKI